MILEVLSNSCHSGYSPLTPLNAEASIFCHRMTHNYKLFKCEFLKIDQTLTFASIILVLATSRGVVTNAATPPTGKETHKINLLLLL